MTMNGSTDVLKTLSPIAAKAPLRVEPAKRPASLRDKTVGLLWNGKPGGEIALDVLAEMIEKRFPGVKFWHSTWNSFPFTRAQHEEIIANCDVAIGTTGD